MSIKIKYSDSKIGRIVQAEVETVRIIGEREARKE